MLELGKLVAVPSRRELGIGRLERWVEADEGRLARVFFYDHGRFELIAADAVIPAPAGVWQKDAPES